MPAETETRFATGTPTTLQTSRSVSQASRWCSGLLSLLVMPGVVAGETQLPEKLQPPTRIGLLLPPTETESASIRRGAELAVKELAEQGSVVELIVRGRPGQWGTEGDEAVVLVHEDRVGAVIAPALGASAHQVLQVAGRTRVPVVSLCPDSSVTGPGIPWTLRIVPRSDEQAQAIFTALNVPDSRLRAAAVVPPERAGREATRDLNAAATACGVELVNPVVWERGHDADSVVARLIATQPMLVLLWVDGVRAVEGVQALNLARYRGRVAGHCGLVTPGFASALRDSALGVIAAVPADSPVAGEATPNLPAALSGDAVRLLADVLRRAGTTPSFQRFPLTNSFAGATGTLTFDRYGNRQLKLTVVEFREGRWQSLAPRRP